MRLSLILTIAIGAIVACNATPASYQNKVSATHARMSYNVVDRRFLRLHQENEETDKEERAFIEKGEVKALAKKVLAGSIKSTGAFDEWARMGYSLDDIGAMLTNAKYRPVYEGYQVSREAKGILADPGRAQGVFQLWENKRYTLTQINNWLDDRKFSQVFNSYAGHLGY